MNTQNKQYTGEDLRVGSIVRMAFCTYASQVKPDWEITNRHETEGEEMVLYVADCKVCNVTEKFFQVIIPHKNIPSVRMSKRCFTDTKSSYANTFGKKAEIVSI